MRRRRRRGGGRGAESARARAELGHRADVIQRQPSAQRVDSSELHDDRCGVGQRRRAVQSAADAEIEQLGTAGIAFNRMRLSRFWKNLDPLES
jgi:hypothetical protein